MSDIVFGIFKREGQNISKKDTEISFTPTVGTDIFPS